MTDGHPSRQMLERFLRADLPAARASEVLRHLVAGCPVCQEVTGALWSVSGEAEDDEAVLAALDPELDAAYDRAIDAAFRAAEVRRTAVEREQATADQLWDELEHHPASRQQMLVRNSARFANASLGELLLAKSHEACFQEPQRAAALAELATLVVERLQASGEGAVCGLAARAWGALGNAQRLRSDHPAAERSLAVAEELLAEGECDPFDRARVLDWKASLRRQQRRFPEAMRLLDRVIAIHRRTGQRHLLGRALAQKGGACQEAGDYETAIELLRKAIDHLDPREEPLQLLVARHNLICSLNETGRHREAFALLFHTRPRYFEHGGRLMLIRLRCLEGKVAAGLGRAEQAEAAYREARDAFMELQHDYDAAEVGLDLAMLYASQGRTAEMRRLAEEMLPVFSSGQIHREALAALIVFQRAAVMEEAGLDLVRKVADFLSRSRNNPDLRFA
jgi:tetratricopeptide (TPR) repeat protein